VLITTNDVTERERDIFFFSKTEKRATTEQLITPVKHYFDFKSEGTIIKYFCSETNATTKREEIFNA
jgi:hypothetical protein